MQYNSDAHHRKSIRIKEYDYSTEGMYFITICTQNRKNILSKILTDVGADSISAQNIQLTNAGKIVEQEIFKTEELRQNVKINDYVIMPNHVHMIIELEDVGAHCMRPETNATIKKGACNAPLQKSENSIDKIIRGLKGSITKQIGYSIWQRNYYEHVIRNEKEYYQILEYIQFNPFNWEKDVNYNEDI